MYYFDYHYYGMNLVWWAIWCVVLFWIFVLPFDIPGQRRRRDSPLDILNKRFASGEITNEEYHNRKKMLTS